MNYRLDFDNCLQFSHLSLMSNDETILVIFQQSADLWNNDAKYGIWDLFVNFSIIHFSVTKL